MTMHISEKSRTGMREQQATRVIFLIAGLGMASWAPLIPFAKAHLNVGEGALGLLLFCIAAGSMSMMPFTGRLIARFGYRPLLTLCALALCFILPLLMLVESFAAMGLALLLFGAANGVLDVTMNAQAVVVERRSGQAKMSGFHGCYSLGSILGAGSVSALLWLGAAPLTAVCAVAVAIALLLAVAFAHLLPKSGPASAAQSGTLRALSHRAVLLIAVVCFFIFLTEGAMLDWSALFMTSERGMAAQQAGLGYALYSVAVALARLFGDRLINRLGGARVLMLGSLLAAAGLLMLVTAPQIGIALLGFVLTGAGLANIVPLLFTAAGNQPGVPPDFAIPAVTLIGYAGLLTGPALIGFAAQLIGLSLTFSAGIVILLLLASGSRRIAPGK